MNHQYLGFQPGPTREDSAVLTKQDVSKCYRTLVNAVLNVRAPNALYLNAGTMLKVGV